MSCVYIYIHIFLHCGWIEQEHNCGLELLEGLNTFSDLNSFALDTHKMYLSILLLRYEAIRSYTLRPTHLLTYSRLHIPYTPLLPLMYSLKAKFHLLQSFPSVLVETPSDATLPRAKKYIFLYIERERFPVDGASPCKSQLAKAKVCQSVCWDTFWYILVVASLILSTRERMADSASHYFEPYVFTRCTTAYMHYMFSEHEKFLCIFVSPIIHYI